MLPMTSLLHFEHEEEFKEDSFGLYLSHSHNEVVQSVVVLLYFSFFFSFFWVLFWAAPAAHGSSQGRG